MSAISQLSEMASHATEELMLLSNDCFFGNNNVNTTLSPEFNVPKTAYLPSSHTPLRMYPSIQYLREFYDSYHRVPMCNVLTQTEPVKGPYVLCVDVCVGTPEANTESDGPSLQRENKYLLPGTDEHLEYIDEVKRLIGELNLTEKCNSSILRRKRAIEKLITHFKLTDNARKRIKVKIQNMLGQRRQEKAMKEKAEKTGKTVAQVRKEQVAESKPRKKRKTMNDNDGNDTDFVMDEAPVFVTPEVMPEVMPNVNPYPVPYKLKKGCVVVVAYDTKSYVGRVIEDSDEECEVMFYAYRSITNGIIYEKKKKSDVEKVSRSFIFAAGLTLVSQESNFLVEDWKTVQELYNKYVDDPASF